MSKSNYSILIVDDDPEFHQQIRYAFRRNYTFEGAISEEHLDKKLQVKDDFDLILMDLVLDESKHKIGLELISRINQRHPDIPIIVVTADQNLDTVVDAMKAGAKDFLPKGSYDFDFWDKKFKEIIQSKSLKSENKKLRAQVKRHREQQNQAYPFIGESAKIKEIKHILKVVSEEPEVSVLLLGETGVGKEVAARYMHQQGNRKDQPFQAINLSAIQDTLLESTLFGHKKGAFTGASRDVEGYFKQAHKGILMLDEIGDIDSNIQIKLLRFLESKLIRPVGSDKDIQLDVQVIAATHKDLNEEVAAGRFRADLFQRLKAMIVEIPPLRDRPEDIELILSHYLNGHDPHELLSHDAFNLLINYQWVGNIRELKNTVNYMLLRKKILGKDIITPDCLPAEIVDGNILASKPSVPMAQSIKPSSTDEEHALIDLNRIENALRIKNKVKKDVAVELGLENTDNLRYLVKKYYSKHPDLFANFPLISQSYKRIVK